MYATWLAIAAASWGATLMPTYIERRVKLDQLPEVPGPTCKTSANTVIIEHANPTTPYRLVIFQSLCDLCGIAARLVDGLGLRVMQAASSPERGAPGADLGERRGPRLFSGAGSSRGRSCGRCSPCSPWAFRLGLAPPWAWPTRSPVWALHLAHGVRVLDAGRRPRRHGSAARCTLSASC